MTAKLNIFKILDVNSTIFLINKKKSKNNKALSYMKYIKNIYSFNILES